jgi:polyhydroxyalkanoate synthase subunit PhaC
MNKPFSLLGGSLEKEIKRWTGFGSVWNSDNPEIGLTPRQAVWKKNKATLWYYPAEEKKFRTPLFLIYSLINQPSILDLAPNNSFIEIMTKSGYDVYLLDFGIPGYEDREIGMENYIVDYIQKGVQRALKHSKAEEISLMGFCLGGTFAAMYAAVADEPIKNLLLFVSPIDFAQSSLFDQWVEALKEEEIELDSAVDSLGLIPAKYMEYGMRLLTSPIYASPYLALLNRADDPNYVEKWRRFNQWAKGHIPLTGAVAKDITNKLVKDNGLVNGTLYLGEKRVDLGNIHADLLVVSGEDDRLVPASTSSAVMDFVSSKKKEYVLIKGGHASLLKGKMPDFIENWLPQRSNRI